jgi:hypothetical protein
MSEPEYSWMPSLRRAVQVLPDSEAVVAAPLPQPDEFDVVVDVERVVVVVVRVVVVVVLGVVEVVVARVVVVEPPPPEEPPHVTPFTANEVGFGLLVPEFVPWNPNVVLPPPGTEALYDSFVAVTLEPLWLTRAFQAEVTVWPPLKDQVRVQPFSASPRLFSVTLPTKPPDHWEATL